MIVAKEKTAKKIVPAKITLQKEILSYENNISSLKKELNDYKLERKAEWKIFKNKMEADIAKIEKSMHKLTKKK